MKIGMAIEGSFARSFRFLSSGPKLEARFIEILEAHGKKGVEELRLATPKDTGETGDGWSYSIKGNSLYFLNTHLHTGFLVALAIEYGHGTRSGRYIQGRPFISPVLLPIFDKIIAEFSKEVERL